MLPLDPRKRTSTTDYPSSPLVAQAPVMWLELRVWPCAVQKAISRDSAVLAGACKADVAPCCLCIASAPSIDLLLCSYQHDLLIRSISLLAA